nr:hypothetical protein [Salsuginibacillus kocurii]
MDLEALNYFLIMIAPHLVLGAAVFGVFLWFGRRKPHEFEREGEPEPNESGEHK